MYQRLEIERRNLTGSRLKNDSIGENLSPMIIYTPIKKEANSTYLRLAKKYFISANAYTGDTGSGQKESVRLAFKNNKIRCLVGTSAFGMGIDKPDVWMTSYIGMPFTLKGLYQAFGRAARKSNWALKTNPIGIMESALPLFLRGGLINTSLHSVCQKCMKECMICFLIKIQYIQKTDTL